MSVTDVLLLFFLVHAFCGSILCHDSASAWQGESRLDQVETVLLELQSKDSLKDEWIRQLQAKVSSQEETINHLQTKVFQQDASLTHQKNQVFALQNELWQHEKRLTQQESIVQYLNSFKIKKPGQKPFQRNSKQHVTPNLFNLEANNNYYAPKPKPFVMSADHDVFSVRSDDRDPLEAVVSSLGQEVTRLDAQIQSLQSSVLEARTSTFVHWGSSQCTAHSHIVYSGVVGGKWYGHTGSGTNLLCLTMSPIIGNLSSHGTDVSYLYGSEYDTHDSEQENDPVCAVCQSSFSNVIMIPGTTACTSGWSRLYSGYLMAQYYNHPGANQFVCVDSTLESRPGSSQNDNGANLFFTVAKCGTLPCKPYIQNTIVTCVVCGR